MKKKLFSLLSIISIIAISNCSSIPKNNDPILGVWVKNSSLQDENTSKSSNMREEWIFNDVHLGRYQVYTDAERTYYTDFKWSEENDMYHIIFSDHQTNTVTVSIKESDNPKILALENGIVFATRE